MIRKIAASLLLAALTTLGVQAADRGDIALEVLAGNIIIPAEDRGRITVKGCDSCPEIEYQTTPDTTFEIGEFQVRRDEIRRELARRPGQVMLLQLTPDRKHVARLKISDAPQ